MSCLIAGVSLKGSGKYVHRQHGYVYFYSGPYRGKREHRVIVEQLSEEGPLKLRMPIEDAEVHHIDFNRAHNCPCNLLVLQSVIHDAFDAPAVTRRRIKWEIGSKQKQLFVSGSEA